MLPSTFITTYLIGASLIGLIITAQFIHDMTRNQHIWGPKVRFGFAWCNLTALMPLAFFALVIWAMVSFLITSL